MTGTAGGVSKNVGLAAELRVLAARINQLAVTVGEANATLQYADADALDIATDETVQSETTERQQRGRPLWSAPDDKILAVLAWSIHRLRSRRNNWFPIDFFGEAAWDMLLDLFLHQALGKMVSTTSLCIASGVPATTALRWIAVLEDHNVIERVRDDRDARRIFIRMTKDGYTRMRECLNEWHVTSQENPTLLSMMLRDRT